MTSPIANCRLHELAAVADDRGKLVALEAGGEVPFAIERVYYLYETTSGAERGYHAHRELRQWMICVSGACLVHLDDGTAQWNVRLDRPDVALEVGPMVWREMREFSPGAVVVVLASTHYDEADYLRSRDAFLAAARQG